MPATQPETEAEIIKARRARWKGAQDCWQKFAEAFLVGKRNFLFEREEKGAVVRHTVMDKVIFTPNVVEEVINKYSSLRGKNREADFVAATKAGYGKASLAEKLVFTHALFAYKLIAKPETISEATIGKKQDFVNCLNLGDFVGDLHWNGVAHTGQTCNECSVSVDYILKVFKHLTEKSLQSVEEVNAEIRRFCEEQYHAKEKGVKWMVDILLWYVASDEYEPIISRDAKEKIVKCPEFIALIKGNLKYANEDIAGMAKDEFKRNKLIYWIRRELVESNQIDDKKFNFYDSNVRALWKGKRKMTAEQNEQDFREWMKTRRKSTGEPYSPNSISQYADTLGKGLSLLAIDCGVIPAGTTFYHIQDKREFDLVKQKLEEHDDYIAHEQDKHGTNPAALKHYGSFLAREKDPQDDGDSSYDEDKHENGDNAMPETKQTPLNQIFYGPPGTGKTFHAIPAALEIIGGEDGFDELRKKGQIAMVTFHENFAYEEFIEGIKPVLNTGELSYQMEAGIFKEIAKKADESRQAGDGKNYVLIIDEINRGNLSRIFGELITLIESDKRLGQENELRLTLPYSKEDFGVPDNLYIIGTMNTADRSTTKLDTALRRRFHFVEMMPNPEKAAEHSSVPGVDCGKLLKAINRQICLWRDREHQIGHTYFMGLKNIDDLKDAFQDKIIPLLQEYFFADWGKIDLALNKNGFIVSEKAQADDEEMTLYEKLPSNDPAWTQAANYKKIYGEE